MYFYISFDKIKLFDANTCEQTFHQKTLKIFGNMQTTSEFSWKILAIAQKSKSKSFDNDQKIDFIFLIKKFGH